MSSLHPEQATGSAPGRLHGVLEPIVAAAGFDLERLDVRAAGRRQCVTIVVDSDHGVGLDDIARVSRAASDELDRHEHLLGGQRHWRRAHLRQVAVRTRDGDAFTGRVGPAGADTVTVLVDGRLRELRYADVEHAGVQVEFRPAPEAELELLRRSGPQSGQEEGA